MSKEEHYEELRRRIIQMIWQFPLVDGSEYEDLQRELLETARWAVGQAALAHIREKKLDTDN